MKKTTSGDVIIYVRCLFALSVFKFLDELGEYGFTNAFSAGSDLDKLMKSTCRYICVNVTQKCYVLCSHSYKNLTVNTEEFKEKFKGFLEGIDYGI
jgi:hypothetical protein